MKRPGMFDGLQFEDKTTLGEVVGATTGDETPPPADPASGPAAPVPTAPPADSTDPAAHERLGKYLSWLESGGLCGQGLPTWGRWIGSIQGPYITQILELM